ncbi:Glycogenin-1 [Ceratocystis fimbriata CBS 114723]|uniref:glycogenin glucosyltransferase n=1 Tax=Ceratocystis fimbriata CBS 114723 TaxID=1035309 RepID=A0A2C5WYB0_9PEZI|nr:Glycogenin-1 [Ceratocystis fimbriata CBS 114723]
MASEVYATLLTNDSYLPGALVLAHSLRDAGTTKQLAVLVTRDTVSADTVAQLRGTYDYIIEVQRISNPNARNLSLMQRTDLHSALTKIALWNQTQFSKIVYIDADVVAVRAPDELFDLDVPFAAAPDIGWPDCFNSGVMMLKPSLETFNTLKALADAGVSFDGADQGLLNSHFTNFHRISFTYNVTPSAHYQYLPAYQHFRPNISLVHFIGKDKPWTSGRGITQGGTPYNELASKWFAVFEKHYGVQGRSGAQLKDIEHVRRFVLGENSYSAGYSNTGFSAWDGARSGPPVNSAPEAGNFPHQVYTMSTDTNPFGGNVWSGNTGGHAAVFPWEQENRQVAPSRVFWEDHVQADDAEEYEEEQHQEEEYLEQETQNEPEPVHETYEQEYHFDAPVFQEVDHSTVSDPDTEHYSTNETAVPVSEMGLASYATTPTAEATSGPSTPPLMHLSTSSDPWAGLNRTNAWDCVPQITRYFEQRNLSNRGVPLRKTKSTWTCVHGHQYEPMDCLCEVVNILYQHPDPVPELKRLLHAYQTQDNDQKHGQHAPIATVGSIMAGSRAPQSVSTTTQTDHDYDESEEDENSPTIALPNMQHKHNEHLPMFAPGYLGSSVTVDDERV